MNHDIFISYSSQQKNIADGVCHYLEENGVKCWMAPRDIPVGSEYGDLIDEAIKACKVVVLVFSESAEISQWVKGEINVAFADNKPILPFRVDETEAKGGFRVMLNQKHWIDAYPHYSDRLPDLLNSLGSMIGKNANPLKGSEWNDKPVPCSKLKKTWCVVVAAAIVAAIVLVLLLLKKPTMPLSTPVLGDSLSFTVNGVLFVMRPVEGGAFQMGNNDKGTEDNEKPAHRVEISSFYMGETEVTQALWKAVMGNNPSGFRGDSLPVESVSWADCQEFISHLNELTGSDFRLPTEAEWEYAARGGKKSLDFEYAGSDSLGLVAWYSDYSKSMTHKVKTREPNELGLYDMSGNVWEWCGDYYCSYGKRSQTNPKGPLVRRYRVLRGGSWVNRSVFCRVSYRGRSLPNNRRSYMGLRIVLPCPSTVAK